MTEFFDLRHFDQINLFLWRFASMPRSQRNDNFIDKTFTVIADILLKILPTSNKEKQAFSYYRDGMSAQSEGEYAEALQNYYEALRLETDAYDRSYILYNIGLIHTSNGDHARALDYYYQALERNTSLPQALNNIAVIYHYRGEQALESSQTEISKLLFDKAADYWREAIRLAPTNYIEAQNWLKMTGRF
jgi:tetratricopeptide (TPR) repeat protein